MGFKNCDGYGAAKIINNKIKILDVCSYGTIRFT